MLEELLVRTSLYQSLRMFTYRRKRRDQLAMLPDFSMTLCYRLQSFFLYRTASLLMLIVSFTRIHVRACIPIVNIKMSLCSLYTTFIIDLDSTTVKFKSPSIISMHLSYIIYRTFDSKELLE